MTIEPPQRPRPPRRSTRPRTPLYDPAFEHDACGIGFVADAGGARRAEVLPLALSGLAALAHRGAFGADGASSDGAGVSLPLHSTVLAAIGLDGIWAGERPAVVQLFLPRAGAGGRAQAAHRLAATVIRESGLAVVDWRTVPTAPDALGSAARSSRPAVVQAIVHRPPAARGEGLLPDREFERRLVVLRRRLESAARAAGLGEDFSVVSASSRTIVYKAWSPVPA